MGFSNSVANKLQSGWAGSYELKIDPRTYDKDSIQCETMLEWIYDNFECPRHTVTLTRLGDSVFIQFREQYEYSAFLLHWS